jgi:PKD repeat protein
MLKLMLSLFTIAALYSGCGSSGCCSDESPIGEKGSTIEKLAPTALISSESSVCVEGSTITFDGRSSVDTDGHIKNYEWLLDGKLVASNPIASFTCDSVGTKEVCLKVSDDDNLSSTMVCQTYTVKEKEKIKVPPVAVITAPHFCTIGETIQVDGTKSHDEDGEVLQYAWRFEDARSSLDKPYLVCAKEGNQSLCLNVTDNDGLTDSNCTTIIGQQVPNKPPVAAITASQKECVVGEHIILDASGSSDVDGYVTHFNWAPPLEDLARVTFNCDEPGIHQVCVSVVDDKGLQSEQVCEIVSVRKPANKPPVAKIENVPATCTVGETFVADGTTSSDVDGSVVAYLWSEDDNTTYATEDKPLFRCDAEGTKEICLQVKDNEGADSQKVCKSVVVEAPVAQLIPPVAKMEVSLNQDDPTLSFTADCKGSYDPDTVDSDNNPQNDGTVVDAIFTVQKFFTDGTSDDPHTGSCPKWISIPDGLDHVVITLEATDDDGQKTTLTHTYKWDGTDLILQN